MQHFTNYCYIFNHTHTNYCYRYNHICTLWLKSLWPLASVWSKITLNTVYRYVRSQGRPSNFKNEEIFFLCLWYFVCQFSTISKNMELWEELSNKSFHFYRSKKGKILFESSSRSYIFWKMLKISIQSAKDIKKMSPFLKFECPPQPRPQRLYLG